MDKEIRQIVLDFEDGKIPVDQAIEKIKELTNKVVDEHELRNYWRSTTLDSFIEGLTSKTPLNWQSIEDEEAVNLLMSILNNLDKEGFFESYSVVLEKRYNKAQGALSDWIFQDDISDPEELLLKLKENTTLLL